MNNAFNSIEEIIKKMLYAMDGNDEFLKLIYIDDRSAIDSGAPTPSILYKNLIDGENDVDKRLFPSERIEEPMTTKKSVVAIDWLNTTPSFNSDDIFDVRFSIDVYTSKDDDMWTLNGGKLRVPRLVQLVYDSIKTIELPTLSQDVKLESAKSMYFDADRRFKGIRMILKWENTSLVGV